VTYVDAFWLFIAGLAVLGFAAAGVVVCVTALFDSGRSEQRGVEYRTRQAEREIRNIGQQARERIIADALREMQMKRPANEWRGDVIDGEIE
jgi:hypothetical protein